MTKLKNIAVTEITFWEDATGFRVGGTVIFDLASDDEAVAGPTISVRSATTIDPSTPIKKVSAFLARHALKSVVEIASIDEAVVLAQIDAEGS